MTACALASIESGELVEIMASEGSLRLLEHVAATLPELFVSVDAACVSRISEHLGGSSGAPARSELLVVSETFVYVVRPLEGREPLALVAVASAAGSVGLVLASIRERLAQLEQA